MRERLEGYLDEFSHFVWNQFQKDLELSERWVGSIEKAWLFLYDFICPRK